MRRTLILAIKCSLMMSGLLLLSVATPSATKNIHIDSTGLDNMRLHNRETLKSIEHEFSKDFIH